MSSTDSSAQRARRSASWADVPAEVVLGCRSQDAASFRAFVVHQQRAVFACLSRIVGRHGSIDDLAQDTFLRAYRAFPGFDPDGPARVSTWLLTIATRVALDARKRRAVPLVPLDRDDEEGPAREPVAATTPESEHARHQLAGTLSRALEQLADDQRAALVLSDFHELSLDEIAMVLEIPVNTVKSRLFRAREKMRGLLGDARAEWSPR